MFNFLKKTNKKIRNSSFYRKIKSDVNFSRYRIEYADNPSDLIFLDNDRKKIRQKKRLVRSRSKGYRSYSGKWSNYKKSHSFF